MCRIYTGIGSNKLKMGQYRPIASRLRTRRRKYRKALVEQSESMLSISKIQENWKHVLGKKQPVVLLHRLETQDIKPDKQLIKCELEDNEVKLEEMPLKAYSRKKSTCSEYPSEVQFADASCQSNVSDSKSELRKYIFTKEVKVVLNDIGPYLRSKGLLPNIEKKKKSASIRKNNNVSCSSNQKESFSLVDSVKSDRGTIAIEKTYDNNLLVRKDRNIVPKVKIRNGEVQRKVASIEKRIESWLEDQCVNNRPVKYDYNSNITNSGSKQRSTRKNQKEALSCASDVSSIFNSDCNWNCKFEDEQFPLKEIEEPLVDLNCNDVKTSAAERRHAETNKKKCAVNATIINSEHETYASQETLARNNEINTCCETSVIWSDNEVRSTQTSSNTQAFQDHKRKPTVRSHKILVDRPFTLKRLNRQRLAEQGSITQESLNSSILTKDQISNKDYKPAIVSSDHNCNNIKCSNDKELGLDQHVEVETDSFTTTNSQENGQTRSLRSSKGSKSIKLSTSNWTNNDSTIPKFIDQPASMNTNEHNINKNVAHKNLIEADSGPKTPVCDSRVQDISTQQHDEALSEIQNGKLSHDLETSKTDTCTSSQTSGKSQVSSDGCSSVTSTMSKNDNENLSNREPKFKRVPSFVSSCSNTPKRMKLNRSSWQNSINSNGVIKMNHSSSSHSIAPTDLLSPLDGDNVSNTGISTDTRRFPTEKTGLDHQIAKYIPSNGSLTNTELISTADTCSVTYRFQPPLSTSTSETVKSKANSTIRRTVLGFGQSEFNTPTIRSNPRSRRSTASTDANTAAFSSSVKPRLDSRHTNDLSKCSVSNRLEAQPAAHNCKDPEVSANAEESTTRTNLIKSRLGPRITPRKFGDLEHTLGAEESTSGRQSVKSRLGARTIVPESYEPKATAEKKGADSQSTIPSLGVLSTKVSSVSPKLKKIVKREESTFDDEQRRKESYSPIVFQSNGTPNSFSSKLRNYKIPKITQTPIKKSDDKSNVRLSERLKSSNRDNETSDDDDYISLHPEESFSSEEDEFNDVQSKKTSNTAVSFPMTDSVFDAYVNKTRDEFTKQFENTRSDRSPCGVSGKEKCDTFSKPRRLFTSNVTNEPNSFNKTLPQIVSLNTATVPFNRQNSDKPKEHIQSDRNTTIQANYFYGYCFHFLKKGLCNNPNCVFDHNETSLVSRIIREDWPTFLLALNTIIQFNYFHILHIVYKQKILSINASTTIQLFKILHERGVFTNYVLEPTISALIDKKQTPKQIISEFLTFMLENTKLCVRMFHVVKKWIKNGDLWETTRDLLLNVKDLPAIVVSEIMVECVKFRPDNVKDVNDCLAPLTRPTTNHTLTMNFKAILMRSAQKDNVTSQRKALETNNNMPVLPNEVDVVDRDNTSSVSKAVEINNQGVTPGSEVCNIKDNNTKVNGEISDSFQLQKIDDLPKPSSKYRYRYQDLYKLLNKLRDALNRNDYDVAVEILEQAWIAQRDKTFYTLSCYRILCQEIKLSECHMNRIKARTSVETNMDLDLQKILAEITRYILIRLVDEGLYVHAYNLLENWKKDIQYNAAFILLMAEIYLGNDQPVEAFYVLKRYNIIHPNRDKWTLSNDARDECVRVKLLPILLNTLSLTNPDYALFMFQFLMETQSSNHYPLDLTRCADKLISGIFVMGNMDLIESVGRLIFKYNISLAAITYRALIATTLSQDVLLAQQLYRSAINLGIYSSAKFHAMTYIIVDPDLTFEEVYLTFKEFLRNISLSIGPGLGRLGSNQLRVYVVLEGAVSFKNNVVDQVDEEYDAYKKFCACKKLIKEVLESRFDPSIKMAHDKSGKFMKVQSKSLVNYLKAGHIY